MEANLLAQSGPPQTLHPYYYYDYFAPGETNQNVSRLADNFHYYMEKRHQKSILLANPKQKKVYTKKASDDSRYTPTGIEKIKANLHKRLNAYKATFGILLTLTIADPPKKQPHYKGKEQLEAWESINKLGRGFTDETNKWRKRNSLKTARAYVKVLEIQPGRCYPHLHIYFPGLKWLAPIRVLQKIWPYSNVDIEYTDTTSPGNYITKYLSKMDARDFMNVMLFTYHLRLYSNSRGLKYAPIVKVDSDWKFNSIGTRPFIQHQIDQYLKAGYSIVGQPLIKPRGS